MCTCINFTNFSRLLAAGLKSSEGKNLCLPKNPVSFNFTVIDIYLCLLWTWIKQLLASASKEGFKKNTAVFNYMEWTNPVEDGGVQEESHM